jgi:hypothetical protein
LREKHLEKTKKQFTYQHQLKIDPLDIKKSSATIFAAYFDTLAQERGKTT